MTTPMRKVLTANCPECDATIRFSKQPKLGAMVTCEECGETLEVVDLSPLELDWAYEDYDDDDDWDEWDDDDYDD